ncbi:hypothetical protein CFD26_103306 [Aspergillus turcosus]|uniref:Zn(2)-C6 fungal-type domain-containing protein n=1 Tax=Aspergillus turcosus TaxID=1245748 RepID=A0A421CVM4_9EURO|nr:hypothetical protein CFD26_103306 [Aspergillus turcosus]
MPASHITFSPSLDPRLRKACDRCHAQKLGCQRSPGARKCVRCTKANKPCSWSISLRNRRSSTRLKDSSNQTNALEKGHEQKENDHEGEQDDPTIDAATSSGRWSQPSGPWNQDDMSSTPMLMDIVDSVESLHPYTHSPIDGTINHDPGELEGPFHSLHDPGLHYNLCSGSANTSGLITPTLTNHSPWLGAPDDIPTGAATPTALDLADLGRSSLGEFQPPTTALQRPAEADPPQASAGDSHRRWLLKIIDINVQLFNHLQASPGPPGPPRNRDQLGDRSGPSSSALDDAIGLSMRLFELLRELSDLHGEETDGQVTPYDKEIARGGGGGGGGAESPTCPLDPGSVLIILSSYMRVLETLSDLLQALNQSTADGASANARLDLPMITVGATTLNQHPRLCLVVFLETVEYMLESMSEHLGCIVRSPGRSRRAGSSGIVSWRRGGSLESSLRDFWEREGCIFKMIAGIRARMGVKKHGCLDKRVERYD